MESLIDGLLNDFEKGKMTRRQLIQSLALVAAAAPAAAAQEAGRAARAPAAPIPQAFTPTGWKTVYLDHISYAVSDYRRSTAFYRDLMGWEIRNDDGQRQCTLRIGDIGEIIIRNNRQAGQAAGSAQPAPAAAAAPGGGGASGRPPLTGVINHVSWGIEP